MQVHDELLDELRSMLDGPAVLTGDDTGPYLLDPRKAFPARAMAVVRPASTADVAAVMRWSAERGVAVIAQGGNTGLSGGTAADDERPTIIMALTRMRTIEDVDESGWTISVQAGVTIEAIQEAASAVGRRFGPDWGARGTATIGGGIATNAGGNNVVRFGSMREQVLGLEVVLADGTVWDGRRGLRKDASGYDLKHLFIGSEGTLGVVTGAVLKLLPPMSFERSALASIPDLDAVVELFAFARARVAESIVAFEIMPTHEIGIVCDQFGTVDPLGTDSEFAVLVKLGGTEPVDERLAILLADAAEAGLVLDGSVAATTEQEQNLWTIRDEINPRSIYPLQHHGLKLDYAVPIRQCAALYRGVEQIASELVPDARTYGFGHIGDGNLHMEVVPTDATDLDRFLSVRHDLERRLDQLVFSLDGTLSAEHGIGRELVGRIGDQKPDIEWKLMRSIKTLFDPDDRLNPGALLPPQ